MPSPWSRRRFLHAGAGLLTVTGGCLSDGGDRTPTGTDTDTQSAQPGSDQPSGPTPEIGEVWITDSVVHVANVDSRTVVGAPDGERLLFATYVDDSRIDPESFGLVVDGERFAPQPPSGTYTDFETIARSNEHVADGETITGFVIPVQDRVERALLTYGDGWDRELSASVRDLLTVEPVFEVRAFSLPETVRPDASVTAELTVANVGTGAGTFRAVAPDGGMLPTVVERELDAGEEATFETQIGEEYGGGLVSADPGERVAITLAWADGRRTATVRIEAATATTESA